MKRKNYPMGSSIIVLAAFLCMGIANALPQSSEDSSKVLEEWNLRRIPFRKR